MEIRLICGFSGSGKSTYAKLLANENNWIIINDDSIVSMLHGDPKTYDKELKVLYKSLENIIVAFGVSLSKSVIIDRPNLTKQTRKRWISLAKCYDVPVTISINSMTDYTYLDTLVERRMTNGRGHTSDYWKNVINDQMKRFQYPSINEGFNKIYYFSS